MLWVKHTVKPTDEQIVTNKYKNLKKQDNEIMPKIITP